MNDMKSDKNSSYTAPRCNTAEIILEGVLCSSFGNEGFGGMGEGGSAPSYGNGEENNGW